MILTIIFLLTALVSILFIALIISLIGSGNGISTPSLFIWDKLVPTRWYIMYPSLLFQIWFWSDKFNII